LPRALGGLDTYNVKHAERMSILRYVMGQLVRHPLRFFYPNDRDAAADTEQTAMHATD